MSDRFSMLVRLQSKLIIICAIIVSTGLSSGHAAELHRRTIAAKPFSLETFLVGPVTARGHFESRIAGISREFTVKTFGRWDGKTLTFVENFFYDDGERDRKTWHITKTGPQTYSGTREDVVGTAEITQLGDEIRFAYSVDLPLKDGSTTRLGFADIITPIDARHAHNTATVYKYFFPIGSVDLIFTRDRR